MDIQMHKVFIYGTLKRGFPNFDSAPDHNGMTGAGFLSPAQTVERFPLVIGGSWFTPYLIPEPGQGFQVHGELFTVDDAKLKELDRLEGTHIPNAYRRTKVRIVSYHSEPPQDPVTLDVWTYTRERHTIDGIHSEPLESYPLDPRYVVPHKRPRSF